MVLFFLVLIPFVIDAVSITVLVATIAPYDNEHHPAYDPADPRPATKDYMVNYIGDSVERTAAVFITIAFGVGRYVVSGFDVCLYGGEGKTRTWEEQGKSNMLERRGEGRMRGIEWEVRMSVWRKGARVKAPLHLTSSHAHIPDLDHGPYLLDQSPRIHPQALQVCHWGVLTHSAVVH